MGKIKGFKQCCKCDASTTYVSKTGKAYWYQRDNMIYCKVCYDRKFRNRTNEIYRHKHCRICSADIREGEYHSPITGKWLCNICKKSLLDTVDSTELEHVLVDIEYDVSIQDKERAKLWVTKMFKQMKEAFLEYGYTDELFITFILITYKQTNMNFPETIEAELNEV